MVFLSRRFLALALLMSCPVSYGFTSAASQNGVDYGCGKIDSSQILNYIGKTVSACGRVGFFNLKDHTFVIGNSLRVYATPQTDVAKLYGSVACATGLVVDASDNNARAASITLQDPVDQIEILQKSGAYLPQRHQCEPDR
ncbi:hypothetical protein [Candidatus Thiodictyon syntrophicum]|uniref:hypothetical protein n=1 Tax=Candidatus Thiodictyon syntrophicum TaxID=1166950 RepID=UPI0012FDD63A|nr:hypothetical protein [Candidatus Thiodictyon syntrophicum]